MPYVVLKLTTLEKYDKSIVWRVCTGVFRASHQPAKAGITLLEGNFAQKQVLNLTFYAALRRIVVPLPGADLQVSHIYKSKRTKEEIMEAKKAGKHQHVRTLTRFYLRANREAKFNEKPYAAALKCGLLCYSCHLKYDKHYLYGTEKAPFDEDYSKNGLAAARWEQWKEDYMQLSASFD